MRNARQVSISILVILCCSAMVMAQEQRNAAQSKSSPVITAAAANDKLRFSSPGDIAQIRLQILSPGGDPLFDSAWKDGNVLDWPIEKTGQALANGSYRCVVMVRDLDGRTTQREAILDAQAGAVSIEPVGDTGLSVVGCPSPRITILAHDEKNGAIINTSGDLSFRFGEFFSGKESEKMRLTAEGNLGIGTDRPQAPLDVNGLIRTSEGILFPDGTILRTAGEQATTSHGGGVNRVIPSVIGGIPPGTQASGASSRLSPRPAAAPDYQFKVDSAGVHIGTTNAFGLDVAGNVTLSSNLVLPLTSSASAGVIMLGDAAFAHNFSPAVCVGCNTFIGRAAGNFTINGGHNTAVGLQALANVANSDNTAVGSLALASTTSGSANTAIGRVALINNTTGATNIAVGAAAGQNLTTGNNNIDIGNSGVAAESATMRIGAGAQTRTFIAGIRGVTVGSDAINVVIDSTGQLGTAVGVPSSRRYKFDINSMSDSTDGLMRLRPVTFRYLAHGNHAPLQYGLIAEEVAEVYPELVGRNKDGEPDSVIYQFVAPMLLNEVQKQQRQLEDQKKTIETLISTVGALRQRLDALERR